MMHETTSNDGAFPGTISPPDSAITPDAATPIKVEATRRGIYPNGVQREKGDKFTLADEDDFSDRWMKRVKKAK
jgi:hypothetical protein